MDSWWNIEEELAAARTRVHHVALREESRRLDLHDVHVSAARRELDFTSRRMELAHRFRSLMRNSSENSPFHNENYDELKKNFRAIQEENMKLQAVITDVTEVNKRWQKYNNDRQMYVQRLLVTIQDQQEQMNKIAEGRNYVIKETPNNEVESMLVTENKQLREENAQLLRRIETLEKEHKEHIEVLEFQMKSHRDDWEAERAEKQQAIQDKISAEAQIRKLENDLRTLKLKVRQERIQSCNHCRCCGSQLPDSSQLNFFTPTGQVNTCPKTYRTSVHLPCTSNHLLSRGTTLCFGDDLTFDGNDSVWENSPKSLEAEEESKRRSKSADDLMSSLCNANTDVCEIKVLKSSLLNSDCKTHPRKTSIKNKNCENLKLLERRQSEPSFKLSKIPDCNKSEMNIAPESSNVAPVVSKVSRSVLHITPSASGSSISNDQIAEKDGSNSSSSGLTIGFDNTGLASVMSFSSTPISKSSSMPVPEEYNRHSSCYGTDLSNSSNSRWSLDSNWSIYPVAGPPDNIEEVNQVSQPLKNSSSSSSCTGTVSRKQPSWKMNYYEKGIDTQTRQDVICPSCGKIFPPEVHLQFLDHFETCQNKDKDETVLKRIP